MSEWFGTSLRRDPEDRRGLRERIDALVLERLEEAVDTAGLDLLAELRRLRREPPPVADSAEDRAEFQALVAGLLARLEAAIAAGLDADARGRLAPPEAADPGARGLAVQAALAKLLPDYWQRFESVRDEFAAEQKRLAAARPGLLGRLFGRP